MSGDSDQEQDSTKFHTLLLELPKFHTSDLSSKFEKASTDADCALSVSNQLKVEGELKFSYCRETKGTTSSTLKFCIIPNAVRQSFRIEIQPKCTNFWRTLSKSSRNSTERSELPILPKVVGYWLRITKVTPLLLIWRTIIGFALVERRLYNNNTLFRNSQSWNGGPRGRPCYRASYLATFKYYQTSDKITEKFKTKRKEHAYDWYAYKRPDTKRIRRSNGLIL